MRLIITTLFFWLLFVSVASADVIFDKDIFPYHRPRPRTPRSVEVPLPGPLLPEEEESHPNAEPDPTPDVTPEEAGFAIVSIGAFVTALAVRESRRSSRRSLQRRPA